MGGRRIRRRRRRRGEAGDKRLDRRMLWIGLSHITEGHSSHPPVIFTSPTFIYIRECVPPPTHAVLLTRRHATLTTTRSANDVPRCNDTSARTRAHTRGEAVRVRHTPAAARLHTVMSSMTCVGENIGTCHLNHSSGCQHTRTEN